MQNDFNDLVAQFLEKRLPQHLAASIDFEKLPPDSQAFGRRMLELMKRADYAATQFNPALMRWLATTIPSVLPSAWGGRIPPITLPGRHQRLDTYVAGEYPPPHAAPPVYIDVGCGFPPVTAADTARRLPAWQVFGVDRSFADFVLYDSAGHYACFDKTGEFLYFQAFLDASARDMYADPAGTRKRFEATFADLAPRLPESNGNVSQCVEKDGSKLIYRHISDFETENLSLVKADLMQLELPPATVIRCMNILVYFQPRVRIKMLQRAADLLADGGLLIAGTNGYGIQTRYAVYRKGQNGLYPAEFAFGLDNLGHIVFMPWFTMHADDPEALLLADLAGTLRRDPDFWQPFSTHLDELLTVHEIFSRGPDGFFQPLSEELAPAEYLQKNAAIWHQMEDAGYRQLSVEVLKRAGHKAWINRVGDIAVEPPPGTLPLD